MKAFAPRNPGERDLTVGDFYAIIRDSLSGAGDNIKNLDSIEWSNISEGGNDISIFWENCVYEMTNEEFAAFKAMFPPTVKWVNVDEEVYGESKDIREKAMELASASLSRVRQLQEMPRITRQGKKVMAGDKPLKQLELAGAKENMVVFYSKEGNILFGPGMFFAYFMDSPETADAMKAGKIPYKLIHDRVRWDWKSCPITDVWKKKFDKDQEPILGMIQGTIDDEEIYVDKMSTRPGYHRNSICTKLIDYTKEQFPDRKVNFSGPTDKGAQFINKFQGGKDWEPAHGESPETDKYKLKKNQVETPAAPAAVECLLAL